MNRESFRSRLGFLLVSAGCAIGIGNVWRFPYVTGKNGGGYFVLFYILCLLIMGVPVLTMELAVGRASHKSAILAYKTLEKPKSKWHIHGWFCLIGCYLLMMYYTTVSGWMVSYFGRFLTGKFYSGMPAEDASAVFGQLLSDPVEMGILAVAIVIVGFIVCSFGLQKGLERVSKVMMIALLALILILAGHSLTLSGAAEGMKFYLLPSLDSIRENGLRNGYLMAIAPTSSTSIIAGTSAGVDPIMNRFFMEEKKNGLMPRVAPELSMETYWYYKSAHYIDQSWSVRAAGVRQRHIDQAQSVNLYITNDYTFRKVLNLYIQAWECGVKTLYYIRSKSLEVEECESCSA